MNLPANQPTNSISVLSSFQAVNNRILPDLPITTRPNGKWLVVLVEVMMMVTMSARWRQSEIYDSNYLSDIISCESKVHTACLSTLTHSHKITCFCLLSQPLSSIYTLHSHGAGNEVHEKKLKDRKETKTITSLFFASFWDKNRPNWELDYVSN